MTPSINVNKKSYICSYCLHWIPCIEKAIADAKNLNIFCCKQCKMNWIYLQYAEKQQTCGDAPTLLQYIENYHSIDCCGEH